MIGVWRSLVARLLREQEVVGSNPATPTISSPRFHRLMVGRPPDERKTAGSIPPGTTKNV